MQACVPVIQNNARYVPASVAGELLQLVCYVSNGLAVFQARELADGGQPHAHGARLGCAGWLRADVEQTQHGKAEQGCNGKNVPVAHMIKPCDALKRRFC